MGPAFWNGLAVAVSIAHVAWIAAVLVLPYWALDRPRLQALQLAMLAIVLVFEIAIGGCPLTDLENALRARADPSATYGGGFIAHQFSRLGVALPRGAVGGATAAWLLLWAAVYRKRRGRPRRGGLA